ncbi:hypothetical protein LB543_17565 [Mesorhizobium sp. ESP7-2]|uniref:hypothetical protein n=1 Tax=Mesorhizobium sp. ESP7-2 TaxID=2876622 RepID=UPI001CCD42C6|nr:hypothetical protein [Mesorhizobium sp. ESP7-2]MBZ9708531.1 hypothetical protein [Mesorhizobium sp. ESP7-2]
MMMNTLEHDPKTTFSGLEGQRHVVGRMLPANDLEDGSPVAPSDEPALKARLREELLLQAQARLPITYASLAETMVGSNAIGVLRDALEHLMDEDAGEGLPLLAAVAVTALEPGLPAPWFFSKAEAMGLFTGDPADLEAYAFHAREFHRATDLHAGNGQGFATTSPPVTRPADR